MSVTFDLVMIDLRLPSPRQGTHDSPAWRCRVYRLISAGSIGETDI